ncbi:matrix metalloproteinase-17-like [Alligator sinensis]|uniref:Matrix metalloproteinase-17-like n=1 Tax=Alligator sinensis TaxID=38654 RepID=A0A3Q0H973_ALLSI|nr:matrix metalloproteinase-17-like [Alligator sinensis]
MEKLPMEQQHPLELKGETMVPPPISAQVMALLLLPLLLALPTRARPVPTPADESGELVDWLMQYGYLPPTDPVTGQLQTWEAVTSAILTMQRFAGIAETGIPDDATLALIQMPRCSLPDILPNRPAKLSAGQHAKRQQRKSRGRRSAGLAWTKRNISWRVKTYPRGARLSRETMRVLIYYALRVWGEATPLTFHEVGGHSADISVEFLQREHGDGSPFDGPGGMVAHAFFPGDPQRAGNVHFDSEEDWTFRAPADDYGMDLFAVAVHEFGHSLGLTHSPSKRSIMRPYYQGPVGDPLQYQLLAVDRLDIQRLYGSRALHSTERPEVSSLLPALSALPRNFPALRSGDLPDRCSSSIDAVTQIRGEIFFFKGPYFWRLTQGQHLTSLRPSLIAGFWQGLPRHLDKVDAVYERPTDYRILFFSGPLYWVFKDNSVEEGYPRPVTDFGLPRTGVDGAFSWSHDQKTYFFKDGLHWRYDEAAGHMDKGFPTQDTPWGPMPSPVDDVLSGNNGEVYAFKGRQYWKFDQRSLKPEGSYPRSIAKDWLECAEEPYPPLSAPTSPMTGAGSQPDVQAPLPEAEHCVCYSTSTCAGPGWTLIILLLLQGLV